ncbi:hypothetical protein GCM10009853_030460 [Glycomyces scopariae]|uniref:BZIP domain-containing protein n=1 Tax=Glycomyces sambucus TaxID=380244 RepID=A0A1G9G239_9ACTN|nr:hypothetical protein [Glycomyces sambucus]SDK94734.1 hypothetical protein SAMN05216298_2167 [Glycomyces sambucus]
MSEDPHVRRNRLQNRWSARQQRERDQQQHEPAQSAGGDRDTEATSSSARASEHVDR